MIARMETSATAAAATSAPRLRLAKRSLFDPMIVRSALPQSLRKLAPRVQARNPVMLVVLVGAVITTLAFLRDLASSTAQENVFNGLVAAFLWFTVLFANFAEAMAEGRGKAQAAALRKVRSETMANRRTAAGNIESVPSSRLDLDDVVEVSAGETIPSDGEIIEGIASVDESAITGESAPVIRESGGDRSAVTGGTVVLSDRIVVRITAKQGQTFIDRMIALVEGAARQQTPNEIALNILLAGLTIIFLLAVVTLQPFAIYSGGGQRVVVLVALLVCLIPTTIGALLSAIGIAGMDRLVQHNVLATSGRAVEAAGDVNTLLLDKTGTITLGNRQATEFVPINGVSAEAVADAAQLSSLADETPEGRSIVVLAKDEFGLRARDEGVMSHARFVPFTAETRMSGVDLAEVSGIRRIRKGAAAAVMKWVRDHGGHPTEEVGAIVDGISSGGGTPLVVAEWTDNSSARAIGVVHLKDIVKVGIRERFDEMRRMSIRTVMITGDNPATAKAIAQEAGVDDFLAEAQLPRIHRADGSPIRVLLVDDEPALTNLVKMALHYEGWDVEVAHDGQEAIAKFDKVGPDVLVLDIMLPDVDGLEILRRVRESDVYTPTLFLTARDSVMDRVTGLTSGADDYMTKPFSLEELVARLRGLLRRSSHLERPADEALRVGDLTLDGASREVTRDGTPISLSSTEFELLRFLMRNPRRALSRTEILDRVWNYDFAGRTSIVDLYISYLRKKIDSDREPMIHTVRGIGYMLRPPE